MLSLVNTNVKLALFWQEMEEHIFQRRGEAGREVTERSGGRGGCTWDALMREIYV